MNILTRFQRWVGGGMVPRNYCRVTFGGIDRFAKYSRHTLLRLQKEHPNNTIAIYRNTEFNRRQSVHVMLSQIVICE